MNLGDRLREIRKARGMSLYDVQLRTGRHFSTIGKYERGERKPSVEFLHALARTYDVTIADIVEDEPFRSDADPPERMDLKILMAMAQRMTPSEVAQLTEFLRRFVGPQPGAT